MAVLDVKSQNSSGRTTPLLEQDFAADGKSLIDGREEQFDLLHVEVLEEPRESTLGKWFGRGISALAAGGCVAIRVANYTRWANALSDIGAGAFTMASVSWGHKDATMARVRQVSLTTFGMGTFFLLTQLYANTSPGIWHTSYAHASIALLGANLQVVTQWLWQNRGIRGESSASRRTSETDGHKMAEIELIKAWQARSLKVLASGGAIAARFLSNDPIIKGLASFAACYWISHEVGAYGLRCTNHQIEKYDKSNQRARFSLMSAGTGWRILGIFCKTAFKIGIPFCFIPWNARPDTDARLKQLTWVGGALGFFAGYTEENDIERIKNRPVSELEEFEKLTPPDKTKAPYKYLAWRVWHVAVPFFANAGLIGFTAWQLTTLEYKYSKIALGMTLGGFLSSYWAGKVVESKWDPTERHRWKDWAMTTMWVAPRILGMNPLFWYLAATNAVLMDNKAIAQMKTFVPVVVATGGWLAYGISLGSEFYRTSSDRIGNQLKWPLMLFANAAITTWLSINAKRGVP